MKQRIENLILAISPDIEIVSMSLSQVESDLLICNVVLRATDENVLTEEAFQEIKKTLIEELNTNVVFGVSFIEKKSFVY